MIKFLTKIWAEQEGQNLPEFALLLFLISLTAVSAMGGVASKVDSMYSSVSTHVVAASGPALMGGSTSISAGAPNLTETEAKGTKKQKPTD